MESYQKLVKVNFPWIDIFDHERPTVINSMHDLMVGVFEHPYITSKIYLYLRIKYTEQILNKISLQHFR